MKNLHSKALKKLRKLFPKMVKIEYTNNYVCAVPCTVAKEEIKNIQYSDYIGKNTLVVNILKEDLIKINAPIKHFMYVTYNRVEYQVDYVESNGIFDDTIHLYCKIFKGGNN